MRQHFQQRLLHQSITLFTKRHSMKMNEKMEEIWSAVNKKISVSETKTHSWWKIIQDRYSEPQRHYHTLAHIDDMFKQLSFCKHNIKDESSIALAVIFHDIIYEPKLGNNEEESANLFVQYANECWPNDHKETKDKIYEWIMATKSHLTPEHNDKDHFGDTDVHYLLDMDLSVLGREAKGYQEYAAQIREEYIHVPDDLFNQKRPEVLETFLKRPKIYCTKIFSEMYEEKARQNISEEINRLRHKSN